MLQWTSKASDGKEERISRIEKHASEGKCHLKDQWAGGELCLLEFSKGGERKQV